MIIVIIFNCDWDRVFFALHSVHQNAYFELSKTDFGRKKIIFFIKLFWPFWFGGSKSYPKWKKLDIFFLKKVLKFGGKKEQEKRWQKFLHHMSCYRDSVLQGANSCWIVRKTMTQSLTMLFVRQPWLHRVSKIWIF